MIKKLLFLFLCLSTCIGSWGQFYKFTGTAQGNLYTEANDGAVATITTGSLCDQNYFVKSDYTALANPLPFTFADGTQEFAVKDYYLNDGDNYTCAFGEAFVSTNTYATANATLIDEANKGNYVGSVYVFTSAGASAICHSDGTSQGIAVSAGEELDVDAYYYVYGGVQKGDVFTTGYYGMTEMRSGFTAANIYTLTDGIYTKISASDKYGDGKDYYAVEFNDLAADYTFPDGTFSASQVIGTITADYTVFYYNGSSYAEVQEGDEYLGEGKYFKYEPGFTSKTPAELVALGYVKAVGAITEVSEDGKTLTILCSGDVCEPDDEFSTEGYKFAAKAVNTIYPGEVENSVKQDDIYSENIEYYTRAQKYAEVDDEEVPTTTKYQLLQSAYVNNGGRYDVVNAGTDINDGAYYALENAGTEYTETVSTTPVYKFNDSANGWVYIKKDEWGNADGVTIGAELDPSKEYVISRTQYNAYNNYDPISLEDLQSSSYVTELPYISADPVLYTMDGSSYIPAAGTVYDEAKKYYSGVSFATIDNIKDNTAYATPVISVNPGSTEYFVLNGETYTKVNAGETYDADKTYYIKDGYDYFVIAPATLISDSYMTSATVAENYWDALVNEINAKGYETVVFTTKEGDAEKATICKHVTHAMMTTTTVNALDFLDVQIDEIKSPDATMTTEPEGTFVYPHDPYKENETITILLLPEIKNAKTNGHKHVPYACAARVLNLNLVVMPNNATCIEKQAFTNQATINTVILNDGLKMIGESAFDAARLNTLGIPESMEYIGKNAFGAGYLHDVYFYGKTAPIVEMDAFGFKAYVNAGAYNKRSQMKTFSSMDKFDPEIWKFDRWDYVNNDYMMALLHLRTDLTNAERARFTDVSRDYHVFELTLLKDNDHYVTVVEESPLKSTSTLRTETTSPNSYGTDKAVAVYWNGIEENSTIESTGAFGQTAYNKFDVPRYNDHQSWENVTGYYDKIVGSQYKWPGQGDYNRSYAVATKNLLWNGTSTIAEGIQSYGGTYTPLSYDSNCDGTTDRTFENGSEYIGIHQFVLVTGDVSPNTTPQEWDFNTIGGANWYTICVPVDMTVKEVRTAFGPETQVCKFNKVVRNTSDHIKFYFTDEQCLGKDEDAIAVVANNAYMIRPSNAKDADYTFTLPHYTVSPTQIPVPTKLNAKATTAEDATDVDYTYTFIGQYNTNADGTPLYMPQYSYYLGADKDNSTIHRLFMQSGVTGKWKPFTCVIIPSDPKSDYDTFFDPNRNTNTAKSFSVDLGLDSYEDNTTTGISYEIVCGAENAPSAIYNLNGQFVGNSDSKLTKGVYIKNGRKFIVK